MLDGSNVEYIGEITDEEKSAFLSGAIALLAPIDWPEPFGLAMIEAMACGTPVIAFNRGSVPEVVDDGLTGFIVEDEKGAIGAFGRLTQLSREKIRMQFERRFTARRMAQEYLALYRSLMDRTVSRLRLVIDGLRRCSSKVRWPFGIQLGRDCGRKTVVEQLAARRSDHWRDRWVSGIRLQIAAIPRIATTANPTKAATLPKRSLKYPANVVLSEAPIPMVEPTIP